MATKFVFAKNKDSFPDLVAGDAQLSSSELRILISLFNHLHAGTRKCAGLSDLAAATSLPEAQGKADSADAKVAANADVKWNDQVWEAADSGAKVISARSPFASS